MPRMGVALAAGGAVLAVIGGLVLGFDGLAAVGFDERPDEIPGLVVTALLVAVGYALAVRARHEPLAAAGATAAALAVPFVVLFATFDVSDSPPFSIDALLLVSTAVWLLSYLLGRTAGRPVFLAAALVGTWLFVLEQVESVFSTPFLLFGGLGAPLGGGFGSGPSPFGGGPGGGGPGGGGSFGGAPFDAPDPTTVGILSVLFGLGYLLAAGALDRRGLHGIATPAVVVGLVALANGFSALGGDLEAGGTGVLLVPTGTALAVLGASSGRRATTWIGGTAAALGALLVVGDLMEQESATAVGTALMVAGALLVAGAAGLASAAREPGELEGGGLSLGALGAGAPPVGPPPGARGPRGPQGSQDPQEPPAGPSGYP